MELTEADRRRVELRYPPSRVPRWVPVVAVALLAAIGLSWLIWAGTRNALPPVTGQVTSFTIDSDRQTTVHLTVQRRDPATPVTCRVIVQATDFETVGEVSQAVPGAAARVVTVDVTIRTLRRGTSASLDRCQVS